ncbi:MAG TPA: hypothetical protein VLN61_02775 [Pseudolabrys sp.]|nr:hypothetical protein [Pseudolabrys sp.]
MASVLVLRAGLLGSMAGAALLLAAWAPPNTFVANNNTVSAGEWRIARKIDRVTSAPISTSGLVTRHVFTASPQYVLYAPPARMQLACFKERAAVIISFGFKIGFTRNRSSATASMKIPATSPRCGSSRITKPQ